MKMIGFGPKNYLELQALYSSAVVENMRAVGLVGAGQNI